MPDVRVIPIVCDQCGAPFAGHPSSKRCSSECKRLAKIALARAWNVAHAERVRETNHRWHKNHRDLKRDRDAAKYAADPDRAKRVSAAWKARNVERVREYAKAHQVTHREAYAASARQYRARKRAVPGEITPAEWERAQEAFLWRCAYCDAIGELQQEHVIPLSRTGCSPTAGSDNVLPACRTCNSRKRAKLISEWRPHLVEPLASCVEAWNPGLARAIRLGVTHG